MAKPIDEILGPDPSQGGADPESGEGHELELISQELIEAVHARNPKDVEAALRAAFTCLDAEPHVEGPHDDEG